MTPADVGILLKSDRPGEYRTACPACNKRSRDDALGVKVEADGSFVAHCFRCGYTTTGRGAQPLPNAGKRSQSPPAPQKREKLAPMWAAFWSDCVPIRETLAAAYLQWRGCRLPPADGDLRFHPKAWHWAEQKHLPCMVALLTDTLDRTPRSLHFTFLHPSGTRKAECMRPRLLLPNHRKQGTVCRLWPDEAVTTGLAIGEGIETALAGAHRYSPAWSAIDAGNLAAFPLLDGIEVLSIFTDHDDAGIKAARQCATTWRRAGREVWLVMSDRAGHDLADEAINGS